MFRSKFKLIVMSFLILIPYCGYTAVPDIKKALLNNNIVTTGKLTIAMADLNGDAVEEAIVRLSHPSQESTSKLQIIILTVRTNDWHIIAKIEDANLPIIGISATSSNWLEILIKSPDSPLGTSYNYSSWH